MNEEAKSMRYGVKNYASPGIIESNREKNDFYT